MTSFFIICFATGLVLSLLSLMSGFGHLHLGHLHGGHHVGQVHGAHSGVSSVNAFTVLAFITWFGGAGYLLMRTAFFDEQIVVLLASLAGFAGAGLLWLALFKILLPHERVMDIADTEMTGVVARVSNGIRDGSSIGEIIFSQMGAKRASAARSEDGKPIERGAEVVVMRYERGIAYVRRWDELVHPDA
jgi:hypothetical protein